MRRRKTKSPYTCEAELCAEFVGLARRAGFKVYPETAEFDLLLVAGDEVPGFYAGDQIGVQAKLVPNVDVLFQALPRRGQCKDGSPKYYAVLVPHAPPSFIRVAHALKISVFVGPAMVRGAQERRGRGMVATRYFAHEIVEACWVPPVEVLDMEAGIKAPKKLTQWKIGAVKLCLLAEQRGYLTTKDFDDAEISKGRWLSKGWVKPQKVEGSRSVRYHLNHENRPPHVMFPEIAAVMQEVIGA